MTKILKRLKFKQGRKYYFFMKLYVGEDPKNGAPSMLAHTMYWQ